MKETKEKSNIYIMDGLSNTARILAQTHDKKLAIVLFLDDNDIQIGMYRKDKTMTGEDIREALCYAITNSYTYDFHPDVEGIETTREETKEFVQENL